MQPPEVDTDVGKTVLSDAASSGLEPTQGPHNENNLDLIAQPSAPEHVPLNLSQAPNATPATMCRGPCRSTNQPEMKTSCNE